MSVELESIAFDESSSFRRRMIAAKDLLRLERLKREHASSEAENKGVVTMDSKVKISISCESDALHAMSVGNQSRLYADLETLADDLEVLIEPEGTDLLLAA